jgi:GntR family phosphonate transport system transcriptional regulator
MPTSRTVSRSATPSPAYQRIARELRGEIEREHSPGDLIPSEHALAARFGVNRHTVRRGIDELVEAGLLVRQRGRGTMVISTPIDFDITPHRRYTELIQSRGHDTSNRILVSKMVPAPDVAADALGLTSGTRVAYLEQVRRMDAMPLTISRHWLPLPRFGFVLESYRGGSLHALLKERLGIRVRLEIAIVSARLPAADDAFNLHIQPNVPVIVTSLTDVDDQTGEPVEYVEQTFRSDAAQICFRPGHSGAVRG